MTGYQNNIKLQKKILLIGLALLAVKFLAYFITNSNAILSDAMESIINVIAGMFGLYSLYYSAQPRDTNHPYGHGKIEFISSGIEGTLIAIAGISIIYKAAYNIVYPVELARLDLGMALVAVAGAVNFLAGRSLEKQGRSSRSPAMTAGGRHLKSDAYSTLGMMAGLVMIMFTGLVILDNIISILFGLIILVTGYKILRRSLAGIMDEADEKEIEEMIMILNRNRTQNWIDIHNFRLIKYGSVYHIDCHVTVPWYFSVQQAHEEIDQIDKLINSELGNNTELFIHTDPCQPRSCHICFKFECEVRQEKFTEKVEWDLENVRKNKKHG